MQATSWTRAARRVRGSLYDARNGMGGHRELSCPPDAVFQVGRWRECRAQPNAIFTPHKMAESLETGAILNQEEI
jgi:hypothetical protein